VRWCRGYSCGHIVGPFRRRSGTATLSEPPCPHEAADAHEDLRSCIQHIENDVATTKLYWIITSQDNHEEQLSTQEAKQASSDTIEVFRALDKKIHGLATLQGRMKNRCNFSALVTMMIRDEPTMIVRNGS